MKNNPWTKKELEMTLAFYLSDKSSAVSIKKIIMFNKDLSRMTGIYRTANSIGLRISNYKAYDADFPGNGLYGGGKAAENVFMEQQNPETFSKLMEDYADFLDAFCPEREEYPSREELLNLAVPHFVTKGMRYSTIQKEINREKEDNYEYQNSIFKKTPRPFSDLPVTATGNKSITSFGKINRDPQKAANALAFANYYCEIDHAHPLFIRKSTSLPYTEPHHLIPLSMQGEYDFSLDVEANIISLCSNCHNEIHYGKENFKLISLLYQKRIYRLEKCGIKLSLRKLKSFYR